MDSRRGVLAGLAMLSLAPPSLGATPTRGRGPDMPVDATLVTDYVKLRASLDARPSVVWGRGVQYGSVEGSLVPFFERDVIVISRATAQSGGVWRIDVREASFVTDLATDQPLRRMVNPLTDREMSIPATPLNAFAVTIDPKGVIALAAASRTGVDYRAWLGRPRLIGGEVGADERLSVHITETDGRTRWLEEVITHRADIVPNTRDVTQYRSRRSTVSMRSWPEWTGLEGKDGFILGMYQSRRLDSIGQIPREAYAACAALQPDILAEVEAALQP